MATSDSAGAVPVCGQVHRDRPALRARCDPARSFEPGHDAGRVRRSPRNAISIAPPIPYYGGKQRIASRIVAEFPPHRHYVEPFAGGLSVLLAKGVSHVETVNDLDHELVTFWRVLRDRPGDLIAACNLTPHSRAELALAREPMDALEELEVARRVWSELAQGRSGRRTRTGWRFYVDGDTSSGMAQYLASYTERMPPAAQRLASVQLECMPALDLIRLYGRARSTLLYVDPLYLGSDFGDGRGAVRTRRSMQYKHELHTAAEHTELAKALNGCVANVVLSGYHSELYADLYRRLASGRDLGVDLAGKDR